MAGNTLNLVDRLIGVFSPRAALQRYGARSALNVLNRPHEATESTRLRKLERSNIGPNNIVSMSAAALRSHARNLERNSDIARGMLKTLTNNIVGSNGIGIEPQPRKMDGTIHTEYSEALRHWWRDWCERPEVTGMFTWSMSQRMLANAWLRDGEAFGQHIIGPVSGLVHGTQVPYSIELIEADLVPLELSNGSNLHQGIERNAWGAPTAFWIYKGDPRESLSLATGMAGMKRIEAARIMHIARRDRIGQQRGLSEFGSVINRLQDIKEYEDSERIAAKVAAALTAYIKRESPDGFTGGEAGTTNINLSPGTIIDSLKVGEEIGMIDSKRPNPNVVTFRQGQLRATAAGIGASYSSIAKSYDGTFSAQRQELVESWVNYATLSDEFVGQCIRPVWRNFVMAAHLSGVVPMPKDLKPGSWDDALYVAQSMPWIDPLKEAEGYASLVRSGFASEVEVLRKRGVNPRDLLEQISAWRKDTKDAGLVFTSDPANNIQPDATVTPAAANSASDMAAT